VINSGNQSFPRYGREHVFKNVTVSPADLATASEILGKSYKKAQRIEHDLYGGLRGFSAVFSNSELEYSEAFAGSGEITVLNLVVRIREQSKHSLILLDEPEVSLHPAAQKRLLKFLMQECKKNHHQVVFTTHSPHMVEPLPSSAIKVFTEQESGRFDIVNNTHPYAAFHRLGATLPGRVRVLVEDRLASPST
jgi:predicted ATP-dependent endonuclease of OLD family